MIARPALPWDIDHVCRFLRRESADEAFASMAEEDRGKLADNLVQAIPRMSVLFALQSDDTHLACALVGLGIIAPGRGAMIFLATEKFPAIGAKVHRWWLKDFVPKYFADFRRIEFTGSAPNTPSGRWLASCGFSCEGVAYAYGKRGEDFGHWAWINPCWRRPTVDAAPAPLVSIGDHSEARHV